jgi:HAD superfamily hydrolase (TIGR01549 family)
MTSPLAVLLDVGGVLFLPDRDRIMGAFARAEHPVATEMLDDAHYAAAVRFGVDVDAESEWAACWMTYLEGYAEFCGVPADRLEEVHLHLDSEFADAALWCREAPGCRRGLDDLAATGVRLGIISNADGLMAERLRASEILQVGPGLGVEVECVIDSGAVGVMKPDPRIFQIALDAIGVDARDAWYVGDMPGIDVVGARRAGLRPFLMDPLRLHLEADYDRVASLAELAKAVISA